MAVAPDFAYFPATQAVIVPEQVLAVNPAVELEPNVPAGQGVQVDPMVEYVPTGQSVHALLAMLPLMDVFPAKQLAHTVESVVSDEGAPATAYFPAGQIFTVQVVDDAVLYVPDGQMVHPIELGVVTVP